MRLQKNQIGDTIVEVLLAVGVVGLAIAGGYGIATRSLKASRQAQERGEALKLAEGQVEAIKGYVAAKPSTLNMIFNGDTFCIDLNNSNKVIDLTFTDAGSGKDLPNLNDDKLDKDYPSQCNERFYNVAVESKDIDVQPIGGGRKVNTYEFKVSVRWFSIGGLEKEEIQINYRMYK